MEEEVDKGIQLLHDDMKADRLLERLEDLDTMADIIHYYRKKNARSAQIALAIVKFLKEG